MAATGFGVPVSLKANFQVLKLCGGSRAVKGAGLKILWLSAFGGSNPLLRICFVDAGVAKWSNVSASGADGLVPSKVQILPPAA